MRSWPWLRIGLLAGLLVAIGFALVFRDRVDPAALEAWIAGFGITAPLVFVVVYALASVLFLPGMVMTLAGGALFGPVWGTLINLFGATLGATAAFLVARYLGADWVSRRLGGRLQDVSGDSTRISPSARTFPGTVHVYRLLPAIAALRHMTRVKPHMNTSAFEHRSPSCDPLRPCHQSRPQRITEMGVLSPETLML